MTGINILAEYTAGGVPMVISIAACVAAVVGLIMLLCGIAAENELIAAEGGVMVLLLFVIAVAVVVVTEPEHTRYKVTISDDINLVEFLERYEILDTEGEIYTIREVMPDA